MSRPDFEEVFGLNAAYAEKVYGEYLESPDSVPEEWRRWFDATLPEEQRAAPRSAQPAAAAASAVAVAAAPADTAVREPAAGMQLLTGVAARIVANMEDSLSVPTATSTREVPVKVLEENRHILNRHQQGLFLPKVSFTHLIAFAALQAIQKVPAMAGAFVLQDGKPFRRRTDSVNFGIAVDLPGKDGRRSLVVPNVKSAGSMDFKAFLAASNAVIDRARAGKLVPDDFADTTWTLTNPGTIGTQSSLPRLMTGQAFILATGAITVPGAFQGASSEVLTELGVSNVMTLTSTYDHRVIQGAESGQFLDWMYRLLLGEEGFYEGIFRSLKVPYRPVHMVNDRRPPLGSGLREAENLERAAGLMTYIRSYRVRGHVLADLDPLSYEPKDWPELDMSTYGLTIWDKERTFYTDGVTNKPFATLREIQETLHLTYCRHIGVEYMHIADLEQRKWLRLRMEGNRNAEDLPKAVMLRALDKLVLAEAFERFLHTRFVGHKRFSLEGGETLIPVLDALMERGSEMGVRRVILGMAHRGRLNVLAHVMQKPLTKIFTEFEGYLDPEMTQGSGDVKYHLGATAVHRAQNGIDIDVELACNPSHLEAVDPVVEGMARARQDQLPKDADKLQVLPVLVHGDAAFAGQGVVHETMQMSQLNGYRTGGTVHVVVNNQIGYTTSPEDSRSTPFCTDIAKGIQAPVFHVNGDDPLAAIRMIRLALEYRMHFQRDVVLDIVCYRRHGHNEGDEPSYTQPLLYKRIEQHPTVREQYQDFLVRAGVLAKDEIKNYDDKVQQELKSSLDTVRLAAPPEVRVAQPQKPREWLCSVPLLAHEQLQSWITRLLDWPADFRPHPKVKQVLARRAEMIAGQQPVDFATAETLAFASLVAAGTPVRLAGQDSGRGTFSQRHATLYDFESNRRYIALNCLQDGQAPFSVIDSLLSEEAALGFEYGYSVARPEALCLWEAQFGDFCNGAQIQIDQFLAAGEAKWGQQSSLVMLLPHGYDGQGPEHSSARLERFLQLCAEQNLRVANPSTASSYYHLLRRQGVDADRKPLIVMTPKSLLRMKEAGSPVAELSQAGFRPVLDDAAFGQGGRDPKSVRRVVACSGKVYYDLEEARGDRSDVAIVRLELLYPFPETPLQDLRTKYRSAEWVFCQEEPQNMGAWTFVRDLFPWAGNACRPAAASPATGSLQRHKHEQADVVKRALGN